MSEQTKEGNGKVSKWVNWSECSKRVREQSSVLGRASKNFCENQTGNSDTLLNLVLPLVDKYETLVETL